jgi:hypothetical protein
LVSFGRGIVCPYRTTTSDYAFWYLWMFCLNRIVQ